MAMKNPHSAGGASEHPGAVVTGTGHEAPAAHDAAGEHSIWPIIVALGVLVAGVGALAWIPISILGVAVIVVAVVGWLWQPWEPV